MAQILIIYHSQSGNTRRAAECLAAGAQEVPGTEVILKPALEAGEEDLLACAGIAVGTPDYFSYMAGGVKDFFDRTFYPTRGEVEGKPCAIFVTHGGGGRAKDSVVDICESFKFQPVASPVMVENSPDAAEEQALQETGKKLARKATTTLDEG